MLPDRVSNPGPNEIERTENKTCRTKEMGQAFLYTFTVESLGKMTVRKMYEGSLAER